MSITSPRFHGAFTYIRTFSREKQEPPVPHGIAEEDLEALRHEVEKVYKPVKVKTHPHQNPTFLLTVGDPLEVHQADTFIKNRLQHQGVHLHYDA